MSLTPDDPRHGTVNGYNNLRCRCDACKQARQAYMRSRGDWRKWRARNAVRGLNARGRPYRSGDDPTYKEWRTS